MPSFTPTAGSSTSSVEAVVASRMAMVDSLTKQTIVSAKRVNRLGGLGGLMAMASLATLWWFGVTDELWSWETSWHWLITDHTYAALCLVSGFALIAMTSPRDGNRYVDDTLLGRLAAVQFASAKAEAMISREVRDTGKLTIMILAAAVDAERYAQRQQVEADQSASLPDTPQSDGAKAWLSAHPPGSSLAS